MRNGLKWSMGNGAGPMSFLPPSDLTPVRGRDPQAHGRMPIGHDLWVENAPPSRFLL